MNKYYVSFGQTHAHAISGNTATFDKDSIAVIKAANIEEARKIAFDTFGQKFAFIYEDEPNMAFFPRGFIELN